MKRSIILVVFVLQAARAVPFVAAADVWQQESYLEEMTTERQSGMRGNMLKKSGWMFGIMLAVAAVLTASSGLAADILIADFEQKTYGDWKVEGEAFGKGPAKGTIGGQQTVSGFEGKGLVNTFLGGDQPTGTLTSPPFTIERDYITFLIGGGGHKGQTCMNLLIDPSSSGDFDATRAKVVLTATGPNNEFLNWENWDVKQYKGKKAVIQIVDKHSGVWGHINVDQISQSDTQAKKKAAPAAAAPRTGGTEAEVTPRRETRRPAQYSGLPKPVADYRSAVKSTDLETYSRAAKGYRKWSIANDPYRPLYHFTGVESWINDPNGPIYHDGKYHLFYQFDPQVPDGRGGWRRSARCWGHAVSDDLVHWVDWPVAVWPDTQYDGGGVYSGNTFIHEGKIHGLYTGNVGGHAKTYGMLTWSEDGGVTFKKKMVMDNMQHPNKHSPVHWDAQIWKKGDTWCQLIGGATEGRKKGAAWLWKSMDLENWIATFDRGAAIRCGLIVRASDRAEGTKVWVGADNTFGIGGCRNTHFLKRDDPAVLHIFVDRGVLESYCDGVAVTHKCFAPADRIEVFAFSEGGEATMIGLNAWKMKAMWE